MDAETANICAQFMQRVDLKGSEVPAHNRVMRALEEDIMAEQRGREGTGETDGQSKGD